MERDPTTAAELHALVAQWPEEAREMDLEYAPGGAKRYSQTYDEARPIKNARWELEGEPISVRHAIDLHVASGIKFLYRHRDVDCITITTDTPIMSKEATRIEMDLFQDPALRNRTRPGAANHEAPTLLHALHAAILATKGDSK